LVNKAIAGNLTASRLLLKAMPLVDELRKERRQVEAHQADTSARDSFMKKIEEMRERMIASGRIVVSEEESSPS
jgi:hypothetical protein